MGELWQFFEYQINCTLIIAVTHTVANVIQEETYFQFTIINPIQLQDTPKSCHPIFPEVPPFCTQFSFQQTFVFVSCDLWKHFCEHNIYYYTIYFLDKRDISFYFYLWRVSANGTISLSLYQVFVPYIYPHVHLQFMARNKSPLQ